MRLSLPTTFALGAALLATASMSTGAEPFFGNSLARLVSCNEVSSCTAVGSSCADACAGDADGCGGCADVLDTCSGAAGCSGGCTGCGGGCGGLGSNLDFGGWLAWGFFDNDFGIDGPQGNVPLGFNNIGEDLVLNQAWLYAAKEAKTGNGLDWGFRCDFLFGVDGPDTTAFGDGSWDTSWQTSNQYGFAMPQLYGEVALGDTLVKVGHFYTIIGYEVVQAPDNFFYSHAYTMYYNEPFTHTGVLAQTPVTDKLDFYYGWTAGWDTGFDNRNDGSVFLGGLSWAPSDDFSIFYATTYGDPGDNPNGSSDTYMHSIVIDMILTENLEWVFQSDFQSRVSAVSGGKSYGINNYLFYTLTDKLTAGMRYEWFRDGRDNRGLAGASEHFHDLALGLNIRCGDNILIKPEVRYDWVDPDNAFGVGGPFAFGARRSMFTWGMQSIWMF